MPGSRSFRHDCPDSAVYGAGHLVSQLETQPDNLGRSAEKSGRQCWAYMNFHRLPQYMASRHTLSKQADSELARCAGIGQPTAEPQRLAGPKQQGGL